MGDRTAAEGFKNQGNAFFKKKDFDNAIKFYTQAIEADPSWAVPYSNRSQAYLYQKKYDEAVKDGLTCMRADEKYVKGYHRAANALTKQGKWVDAKKILGKASKNGFRAHKDLMKLYELVEPKAREQQDKLDAAKPLKERLKIEGNAFFKKGEYEKALMKYQEALDKCKSPADNALICSIRCNRALCFQQQSDFNNVISEANCALEIDPNNPKALMRRSTAFEGMEKYRLALQDVRKVLLFHPGMKVAQQSSHRLSGAVRRLKAAKAGQY